MRLNSARGFLSNLLFPRRCPVCGAVVGFGSCRAACEKALQAVRRVPGACVAREAHVLNDVTAAFAPFLYETPVQDAILKMKFGAVPEQADFFAGCMAAELRQNALGWQPELIVPVPAYGGERRGREDLPRVLAATMARELEVPLRLDALKKVRQTERQMRLSGEERRANVADAFSAPLPDAVCGRNVLIVDDVLTTGSTLNACAKALAAAGAASCCGVCAAVVRF